jgi:signal transduction histidine kinase
MRAVRHVVWPAGLVLLAVAVAVVGDLHATTYGGSQPGLLWLETGAALVLLAAGTLEATAWSRAALQLTGLLWLVPELAGWVSAPAGLRTAADAVARLLPAVAVAALLGVRPGRSRWTTPVLVVALASGVTAASVRLLFVDPFLDPACWRICDHNPLLVAGLADAGRWLERGAAGLTALAAAAAVMVTAAGKAGSASLARRAPVVVAGAGLVVGLAAPGVLRWVIAERGVSPWYVATFIGAQLGATGLAAMLITGRYRQWRLSVRLSRLAGSLRSAPAPGALAEALGRAVGDPGLQTLYWAVERATFVDADGNLVANPSPAGGRRITLVERHGQRLAALVHAAEIDGDRLDRALRPAMRLALENERLRAAALAELREVESSRARIVERAADERRRLERNLHDGAQQCVVSLSLLLHLLRARAPEGDELDLAVRAESLIKSTLEELRRVARGIYPAVLSDAGLAGAVLDLAESSTDVAIRVRQVPEGRYKGTVETTAYLVVAAAAADARSRSATTMSISAIDRDGMLVVDICDDGPPAPDGVTAHLADQVGALGGRVLVQPDPPGTRVRLELPCGS